MICKKTNRVLLFHRSEDVYEPETWGIISGKIDYDENPKDAVLRELVEETEFSEKEVKSIVLKPSYVYKKESFTFYNYLGFVNSEFTPILNWENTDYKWCDIGDYPQPLHFGVSLLLKNIDLKKELYKKTIDDDYIKEVFRYNNGGEFKDVVCSSCGWAWNKHDSEEHDVYVCHKCGTDNNPAHKVSDSLSSQEVEDKLGRKLDWWNDDIVYLSGIKYKKVYLRPEYKKVIE